jgi:hypothetical protein
LSAEHVGRLVARAANDEPRDDAAFGKGPSLITRDQDRACSP